MNATQPLSAVVDPLVRPSPSMFLLKEAFHSVFGGLSLALAAAFLLSIYTKPSTRRILPPGPKGIPFFGNLFQLMATPEPWKAFAEWGKEYGPLVRLNIAGKNMIIMNTHKVAADLLDRRATKYSSRPHLIVASEMLTGGMLLAFQGYTDLWRRMRRAAHEGLNQNAAKNYHVSQEKEALLLVQGVLKDADNWDDELKRATASMILGAIYDRPTLQSCHDPQVAWVNNFVNRFVGAASPKAHYVEYFTWMKYLPTSIAKWKRDALEFYRRDSEYLLNLYSEVKGRLANGDESNSFSASLIRDDKNLGLSDLESSWLAATIYAAGSETSSTVMSWFMLAMLAYPDVQKKVQDELDRVVGRDRMPTFADRDDLPYLNACVREALRWRSLTPMGAPHETVEDDWYEGYFIPKGTLCFANQWAMNRDTDVYGADSDEFRPERHLDQDGKLFCPFTDTHDEGHVSYGFGRRICVGRHVATNGLFINIASLLWAATVSPVTDNEGNKVIPDTFAFINNGLVLRPQAFNCDIKPRFAEVEAIVSQTKELYHS